MGGIVSCIGFLGAGEKPQNPDVAFLALKKGCIIRGIVIGSREQTEQLMNLVDQKKLQPPVYKTFNFDPASIKQAYQYLESQTHMGKICIKM
jgi:D-arabinose 1-dehydrogenase-like Zn-dependent alcohol dehydrogenase